MGGEDVFAVTEAPEEGERGVEDEGPDQQHAGHGQTGVVLRRSDGHRGAGISPATPERVHSLANHVTVPEDRLQGASASTADGPQGIPRTCASISTSTCLKRGAKLSVTPVGRCL